MTTNDVITALCVACNLSGSQTAWASKHRVNVTTVSAILRGEVPPPPSVLSALRIEKIVTYRWIDGRDGA